MVPLFRRALLALPLTAAATIAAAADAPTAEAELEARSGSQVAGVVIFTPQGDKVKVSAKIKGLAPGEHGFHIHEAGDCSAPDAASAKGHFNPGNKAHGAHTAAEHHAGDLPNLVADAGGRAEYVAEVSGLKVSAGADGILNRAIVIHADADDYKTQPAGNSGKRVACGVIHSR